MSFNNSQLLIRGEPTFNNVHGDQVNTTITAEVVHMHGDNTKITERTIFGQFEDVKRGHVIGTKELYSEDLWTRFDRIFRIVNLVGQRHESPRKTISTVQVYPDRQSKFTAITYEGKDAQEAWQKDFEKFFRASRTGSFQLFGINRSDIPMLIFHHELIPLAHFFTDSLWLNIYIYLLKENKRCSEDELWLNTSNGFLCKGPYGPDIRVRDYDNASQSVIQALPSTVDMLEEGSFIAFFSKFRLSNVDGNVLQCAYRFNKRTYLDDFFPKTTQDHRHKDNNHPQLMTDYPDLKYLWRNPPHYLPIDIIGGLRFDTVYSPLLEPVARWPQDSEALGLWEWEDVHGLVEETRADGGLTRFKLDCQRRDVSVHVTTQCFTFQVVWLSQSSYVFDLLKTTGDQENFVVVSPPSYLGLCSTVCEYNKPPAYSDAVGETRPIYLFLYPSPMTISELISWMGGHTYFWSFDEDGQSRIPENEWDRWGIPILIPDIRYFTEFLSWPTHIYTALRKWQITRGFDPSTADWARDLGCPELEIVGAKKSWWSWSAFAGSDISACPC